MSFSCLHKGAFTITIRSVEEEFRTIPQTWSEHKELLEAELEVLRQFKDVLECKLAEANLHVADQFTFRKGKVYPKPTTDK